MRIACAAALVVLALIVAVAARPAAACSKRHQSVFELFDLARDVAVVRVERAPRARRAGPVALRVEQRLKGGRGATLAARETNSSCAAGFQAGHRALVFLDRDRWPTGAHEGYVEAPRDRVLAALTAWARASSPAARVAVLVAAIGAARPAAGAASTASTASSAATDVTSATTVTDEGRSLALDAAYYLADHPELIALLDERQVAALVAARGDHRSDDWIALVLARQHGAAWRAMLAGGTVPLGRRQRPVGVFAALVDHDYEAITDVAALAALVESTPGETAGQRIAAFERCERVHGRLLAPISSYGHGRSEQGWQPLVAACRTGTPAP